jgi:methylated-DNA-[protein]-cysteine S-methyltransferase
MKGDFERDELVVFASELGWMSLRMRGEAVAQLSFGHPSATAATRAIAPGQIACQELSRRQFDVVERLREFAQGIPVDFCDLPVDYGPVTDFQGRVLKACREIPYGKTITYGELAVAAYTPRAARAVGNCMAGNRVPLIIPCHRVVRAGGDIGPYSAAGGSATKRRLLQMEAAATRGSLALVEGAAAKTP